MQFGKININPAKNPAVLDTGTWDEESASTIFLSIDSTYWHLVRDSVRAKSQLPATDKLTPYSGSAGVFQGSAFFLATLRDGQQVFIEIGTTADESVLGAPAGVGPLDGDQHIRIYKTNAATIDRYCQFVKPEKGPKAMGAIPRLGIGVRMTTAMWPGVYRAMHGCGFAANSIQNSVRELELLENILKARPAEAIYYPGFGTVESGHTGSTFEGLWVYGVLEALKSDTHPRYGADADHIKVLRGADGMARAKHVVDIARYYSFFTLDVSDILDYEALAVNSAAEAAAYLSAKIRSPEERRAILAYHGQKRRVGGNDYQLDEATIGRLVGKYWDVLEASQELVTHIHGLKGDLAFDLEFAIDERPPELPTCECITTDEEVAFVLLEAQRRHLPLTHLAPNFGVEKGVDYRCPDGLQGLEARVQSQYQMATEFGVLLDFHSGDDLSSETRCVIGRATQGRNHFKIAPQPQIIFAETVHDFDPELFQRWWDDAWAYARREAGAGSEFATDCIREYEAAEDSRPSPHDSIFHNFGFAFVGRRDANGQYLNRETLYDLSPGFYREYQNRIESYLCRLAEDLFTS